MGDGSVRRVIASVLVVTMLLLGATGCAGGGSATSGGASDGSGSAGPGLPESSDPALEAGRQLVLTKCKMCHSLDRIKAATHDVGAWESTVARMRGKGAVLTEDEAKAIVAYLASR